ncbi:MAG TPA: hypothetical protein VFG64_11375 [Dongiaceae bacterium]|nr:hypothetical protein [Dongiaceae bacterium]
MSEFSINLPPRLPNAGPAPNILTAVIPDPPRQLLQLDSGTIIKGLVQGRDADGLLVIVTDKGALKLSTPANIPTGSQVTLEVRNAGDRLQVLVLSVDGQPASSAGGQGPRTGAVPPAANAGSQPPAPPPPAGAAQPAPITIVGSQLQGTIVQAAPDTLSQLIRSLLPSPPAAAAAGALPAAPASTQPALPAVGTAPSTLPANQPAAAAGKPATAAGPNPVTSPPSNGAAGTLPNSLVSSLQAEVRAKIEALFFPAAPAKGGLTPAPQFQAGATLLSGAAGNALGSATQIVQGFKLPIPLVTGSEVRLRLIAIAPEPGLALAIPASTAGVPHVMAGRIIGYTPAGNAVLHSPLGAIILQGALSLPLGTELAAAIEPVLPMPAALFSTSPLSLPQLLLSVARGWPSLADVLGVLRQGAGDTDALAALSHLPQAGPKLAAGLVAAMQAIRAGNADALLGALVAGRSGDNSRDDAARKVRQEFTQLATFAQERPGIDWRCCFIPVLDDGTIRQINLFYRRDRRKDRKDAKDDRAGTRFIVEVDMSRMGPFQFDGLVREKQFDLMVRSRIALPPKARLDMTELFQEALALGDYRGGIVFQKVKEFPVSPLEEIEKSATRVSA